MSNAEITSLVERVAAETATKTANEVFTRLGIDATQPFEAQADFFYLRKLRTGATKMQSHAVLVVLTTVISTIATAVGYFLTRGTP